MQIETIKEKRKNTLDKIDIAKEEVRFEQLLLKENLEYINKVLYQINKLKKIEYCFNYLIKEWSNHNYYEDELDKAKKRLNDFSHLYENAILRRKLLKSKLKDAQRKFSKKQKKIIRFDKKYYNN